MDIVVWLRGLGLEQYEAAFRENAIDFSVLPDVTDQDLEKLGVLLGHRRKLLRAIANLETSAKIAPDASTVPASVDPSPRDTAERRQVTVMFSDLVGSTALSARMDPEDLREVITAYQTCVAETVGRLGGFIAKFMGDGVLVYFGYPHAHEDDAERAVRAGLKLVAAVSSLKTHAALKTRVGIATGLVVVGAPDADVPAKINLRGVRYTASGFVLTHQRRFSLPSPTELTFRSHPGHMGKWLLKWTVRPWSQRPD
jgi:hypothetical protein